MQTTKLKLVLEPDIGVPYTGQFLGSTNALQNVITVVAIIAALAIVTTIVGIIIYRLYKAKKVRLFTPILLILGLLSGIVTPMLANNRTFAEDDYAVDFKATKEVSMEGAITEATFTTGKAVITMPEATEYGYILYIEPNEANEDLNFIPKTDGNKTKITSVEKAGKLAANTYGFTTKKDAKAEDEAWEPLSNLIKKDGATDADDITNIYFGVLTDDTVLADTYELDVDFYILINNAPDTPEPDDKIGDLVYMQELKDSSKRNAAAELMVTEKQYRLKDIRDNKTYYVAKLKDGNIWMTQNLDHDIRNTAGFYTPQNTDIPDIWTAGVITYTTNDHMWNGTNFDAESYDPGDYCWDGEPTGGENGTLSTNAVPCDDNDRHYAIGNYYNWTAAMATDNSAPRVLLDFDQSICPAGWYLPDRASFSDLVAAYPDGFHYTEPTYFTLAGSWGSDGSRAVGNNGVFWTNTPLDDEEVRAYAFASRGASYDIDRFEPRGTGRSVRCMVEL